jgi:hypothetical protein
VQVVSALPDRALTNLDAATIWPMLNAEQQTAA